MRPALGRANEMRGFLGIKAAYSIHVDTRFSGEFRRPLPAVSEAATIELHDGLTKIFELERSL